jgi:hypothetical protein
MKHHTFHSIRNEVPDWQFTVPMDWSWWPAEVATAVTGHHFYISMQGTTLKHGVLREVNGIDKVYQISML